jgi:Flp pilus assembly protein TadD
VYAIACGLAYRLMRETLADRPGGAEMALVAAVLFAVHPVHTEVVANVKGLDESLAMVMAFGALIWMWRTHASTRWVDGMLVGLMTFLACLAKEVAFMLVILAPLLLWVFTAQQPADIVRRARPVWAGAAGYLLLRLYAVGLSTAPVTPDPLNDPFLVWSGTGWTPAPVAQWLATIIDVLLRYVRLMVWPVGLTHDYYPWAVTLRTFADPAVWAGLVLLMALGIWLMRYSVRRNPIAFGLLWFLLALLPTINLFVNAGTFMAERFLFLPSFGGILAFSAVLVTACRRFGLSRIMWIGVAGLGLLLGALTWSRNADWRSNEALMRSAAKQSANSAKWRNDMGTVLLDSALVIPESALRQATLDTALGHLVLATTWHPTYFDAWVAQGACAYYTGDFALSVKAYRTAAALIPGEPKASLGWLYALRGHGADLVRKGQAHEAIPVLRQAWQMQPDTATGSLLWKVHAAVGPPDSAAAWLGRTLALAPTDPRLLEWVKGRSADP